jgi:hypothetical protein
MEFPGALLVDTARDGWESFERVEQPGHLTGNAEWQDFVPSQVLEEAGGGRRLQLQWVADRKYVSGKLRSKWSLAQMAPGGGALEVEVEGPARLSRASGGTAQAAAGLWPAVWLLPDAAWPTGGELDIFEQMQRGGGSSAEGFSTLHFGPRRGADAVWQGSWGLQLGRYAWRPETRHTLRFDWRREASRWRASLHVDGARNWEFSTSREDVFAGFERGKAFHGASPSEFAPGAAGDPARIFQRAFDRPEAGLRLICNLSFGGTPFGGRVDAQLRSAALVVHRVRLFGAAPPPAPPPALPPLPPPSQPSVLTPEVFVMNLGPGWSSLRIADHEVPVDVVRGSCGVPLPFPEGCAEVAVELRGATRAESFVVLRQGRVLVGVRPSMQGVYVWCERQLQVPAASP